MDDEKVSSNIGKILKLIRMKKKQSQQDVALKAGVGV